MTNRLTKLSVTNFLHCQGQWLFGLRPATAKVDAGRLNGLGGKLEPGENYLQAAIRETYEETGYQVSEQDCELAAVVSLTGGYAADWVMCFFRIEVPTLEVPHGLDTREGQLMWFTPDQVKTSGYELVDDLNILWPKITEPGTTYFMQSQLNEQEKIVSYQLSQAAQLVRLTKSPSKQ